MSELPALQAMLRETAERRYGRSRARAIPARIVAVAAAAALAFAAVTATRGRPDPEVAATPTPEAPLSSSLPAIPVDARGLHGYGGAVERAWSVPWLRGTVMLYRTRDGDRCLSIPDPRSPHPQTDRGQACVSAASFRAGGVDAYMFATGLHVGPRPDAALTVMATTPRDPTGGSFTLG